MRTIEVKLYQYDELEPAAQEKARDWYKSCRDESDLTFTLEDMARVCSILGIELDTRPIKLYGGGTRQELMLHYILGYSQDDGAAFTGTYQYKAGFMAAIKAYAPQEVRLHKIARALYEVQKDFAYKLTAQCTEDSRNCPHLDVSVDGEFEATADRPASIWLGAETDLTEALRELADWFYQQIRTEDEYQCEDAQVAESIRANEYEFTEDGKRA